MGLDEYRKKIDKINSEILDLLKERFEVVKKIGKYKKERGMQIEDKGRENEIFKKLKNKAREKGLREEFIEDLFKEIISEAKRIEK